MCVVCVCMYVCVCVCLAVCLFPFPLFCSVLGFFQSCAIFYIVAGDFLDKLKRFIR